MPFGGLGTLAALGIAAGIGGYQTWKGSQDAAAAQNAANANIMPKYNIPQSEFENQNLAESQATQGISPQAMNAYKSAAQEGLTANATAIQRGGGDVNALAGAGGVYNRGIGQMALYDDQARMQNMANLYKQNQTMSDFKDKQWQLNEYAPWANKAQAIASQLAAANNMENAGLNTLGKTAMSGASILGGMDNETDNTKTTTTNPTTTNPAITAPVLTNNSAYSAYPWANLSPNMDMPMDNTQPNQSTDISVLRPYLGSLSNSLW